MDRFSSYGYSRAVPRPSGCPMCDELASMNVDGYGMKVTVVFGASTEEVVFRNINRLYYRGWGRDTLEMESDIRGAAYTYYLMFACAAQAMPIKYLVAQFWIELEACVSEEGDG